MKTNVSSLPLYFGDAEITFFNVNIDTNEQSDSLWHRHSYYEIHVCREGCVEYTFENERTVLRAGEVLIIAPDTPHFSVDREKYSEKALCVISFGVTKARGGKKLFDIFTGALDNYKCKPIRISKIAKLELELFYDPSRYHTVKGVCRLNAVAAQFLSLLFESIIDDTHNAVYGKRDTAVLIDNMINLPSVTLDDIAKATSYSKRHVSRLIREKYGCSLGQLRKRAKEHASNGSK